jgi:hypothetical protein
MPVRAGLSIPISEDQLLLSAFSRNDLKRICFVVVGTFRHRVICLWPLLICSLVVCSRNVFLQWPFKEEDSLIFPYHASCMSSMKAWVIPHATRGQTFALQTQITVYNRSQSRETAYGKPRQTAYPGAPFDFQVCLFWRSFKIHALLVRYCGSSLRLIIMLQYVQAGPL